jgi:hypothetical protein
MPARLTAPPSGLFLERVHYGNDARTQLRAITPLGFDEKSRSPA